MVDALCVIGTDTDAGKTVVTAAIARAATSECQRVLVIKPVQTGCCTADKGWLAPDVQTCRRAAPRATVCAFELFEPACSPHRAAQMVGRVLSAQTLAVAVQQNIISHGADMVLIEGAGGLCTPLSETETLADLLVLLGFPVLLVVGNKLGAVNHALLSLEACTRRGLRLVGFVSCESTLAADEAEVALRADNVAIIEKLGGVSCLACLPYLAGLKAAGQGTDAPADGEQRVWEQAATALRAVVDATKGE